MKNNLDKYINEVSTGFIANRGKASVYCFHPISYADLVLHIINQFYTKSPGVQVFIVVDGFVTRTTILKKLGEQQGKEYNVKVLSADYIKTKYNYDYRLILTVGVNDNLELIKFLHGQAKFMLSVFTKNIMDVDYINSIREILPAINVTVSNVAVRSDSIYSPVEEYRMGVALSDDDKVLYDKCSDYISTCVSIFGDLSNIEKCKFGDPKLNISGAEFRESIAKANGWNLELDTTLEWSRQIDDVYNPNVLYERANTFYSITKQRRDLVTDNSAKLEVIKNICSDHKDKKILIVSKRGEFAAAVTKYINEEDNLKCGDYHDSIDNAVLVDEWGDPVLVKSGVNKGKPKIIGAQAISTLNMSRFNNSDINVLSIKNSSTNKLKISVDVVIFTSSFIDEVIAFKTRFADVEFNSKPTCTYKVYCIGTIEHKQLAKQKETPLITVIEDNNNIISYDETNDVIIL